MSTRPHPLDQVGIRFGIAGALLVAVVIVSGLARVDDGYVLGAVLVATAALGATVNRGLAAVLGLTAWALATGFVTNAYGLLTFAGADLELMAALVVSPVLTSHLAGAARHEVHGSSVPRRTS